MISHIICYLFIYKLLGNSIYYIQHTQLSSPKPFICVLDLVALTILPILSHNFTFRLLWQEILHLHYVIWW